MQIKKAFSLYSLFVDHYPFRMNDTCVVASLYILINSARTSIRSTTLFYLSLNGSVVGCLLTTTGCWMHLLIKHKRPTADSHKQRRLHFLLLLFLLLYLSVFFCVSVFVYIWRWWPSLQLSYHLVCASRMLTLLLPFPKFECDISVQ